MTISMIVVMIILLMTIIMASLDSSTWTVAFFYITIVSITILNMAAGVFQNLSYALAAQLPMKYTNAIMVGQNASGTCFAVALIITLSASPDEQSSAIAYFSFGLVFMLTMFAMFQYLFRNEYYKSMSGSRMKSEDTSIESFAERKDEDSRKESAKPLGQRMIQVLKECWPQVFNAWCVYFVGLAVFPAVQVGIKSNDNILSELYFTPVTCFLMFNVTALIGTLLTSGSLPIPGPKYLWIGTCARILFIPFFLFCNFDPLGTRTLGVAFKRDWIYCVGSCLQGLSLGYLGSLAVMYAPRIVSKKQDSQLAGMMAGLACMTGMFTGVLTGFIWPRVV